MAAFVVMVVLPLAGTGGYLWGLARDQYASRAGFTVRQEDSPVLNGLAGGLAQMLGGSTGGASNGTVLHEYIQSQPLVERIEAEVGLRAHYSQGWPGDPLYAIWPDASIETLTRFWSRMVHVGFDAHSGLMGIDVLAHDPRIAQTITSAIVTESQAMINRLNETARADAMSHADADLAEATRRLRTAREALAAFRATTQIVDPLVDLQGRMGILNSLQAQLAQSLVDLDLLTGASDDNDPRQRQLRRRIEVIRDRIVEERRLSAGQDVTTAQTDYPTLLSRYEGLVVDLEIAEATFRNAQAAHDLARAKAERQTLYLATHIRPTLAERAEYPARFTLMAMAAFVLVMLWGVVVLVYYSLRDRG